MGKNEQQKKTSKQQQQQQNIKIDFLKHEQENINVESRRFGEIMTPFSRQSE